MQSREDLIPWLTVCGYSGNIPNYTMTEWPRRPRPWITFHSLTTRHTLCEELLKDTGIVVLPGASFERPKEGTPVRLPRDVALWHA